MAMLIDSCPMFILQILRQVLSNLTLHDLLTCSLVNKYWNYEARSILRDYRKCCIQLKTPDQCLELMNLSSRLPRMNVIPYNGLIIDVDVKEHFRCVHYPNVDTKYEFLLNYVPLRYLTVEWAGGGEDMDECPILDVIDKLLLNNSCILEELKMSDPPRVLRINRSRPLMTGEITFPALKVLQLNEQFGKFDTILVAGMTIAAPNLKEISGLERTYRIRMMVPPNYYCLVKDLWLALGDTETEEHFIRSFAGAQPKLRNIMIEQFVKDLSDVSRQAMKLILESSRDSLENVKVGACALIKLIRYGMPPLESVKYLELYFDGVESEAQTGALRSLDFAKYFPSLKSVCIGAERGHQSDIQNCVCILQQEQNENSTSSTCKMIDQLRLQVSPLAGSTFEYFTNIFASITSFEWVISDMLRYPNLVQVYCQLWSAWPHLESLKIFHSRLPLEGNLDWVYCGIDPEEAQELYLQDENFLDAVNVVPIQPSIACVKGD